MATLLTNYDVVGAKEDVSDIISLISPSETPFTSAIGKDSVHNTLFSWQEDALATPNLSNRAAPGAVFQDLDLQPTVKRSNNTQIMTKVINVAGTTDAISKYGRDKETAYQMEKKGKEVKIDKEAIYLSGQSEDVGTSVTGGATASFQAMIDSSLRFATGGATTAPTYTQLKSVHQTLTLGGGEADTLMIPYADSAAPGTWAAQVATPTFRTLPNSGSAASTVTDYVDVVVLPTGTLKIMLNRFSLNTDYFMFSKSSFKDCALRPWFRETLAKVSDSTRIALVGEYGLKHVNFKKSAVIRKVTGDANGHF